MMPLSRCQSAKPQNSSVTQQLLSFSPACLHKPTFRLPVSSRSRAITKHVHTPSSRGSSTTACPASLVQEQARTQTPHETASDPSHHSALPRTPAAASHTVHHSALPRTPAAPQPVLSHLVGKPVLQLSATCSYVPLLDPRQGGLPFAASLQIHTTSDSAVKNNIDPAGSSTSSSSALVELHYVIKGSGYFTNASTGQQQALHPGDSVIGLHGAACFAAGPMPRAQPPAGQQHSDASTSPPPAWPQLVDRWLQQLNSKQQPQQQLQQQQQRAAEPAQASAATTAASSSQGSSTSQQLVMLRLLLPTELLTGQLLSHHEGHCHTVAAQLPYLHTPPQQRVTGSSSSMPQVETPVVCSNINEAEVCGLLADAGLGAFSSSPMEQQQHTQEGAGAVSGHTTAANSSGPSAAADAAAGGHNGTSSSSSSDSHVAPASGLSSLNQQQTLKRALSEVGAFRLPQQTNRLALLFGPHSSPAVCCSFGVEVFDPGHVTPLHIHNTAHELFFVLGGRGEAVFTTNSRSNGSSNSSNGSSSSSSQHAVNEHSSSSSSSSRVERVVMRAGDVACFPPGVVHGVDNPSSSSELYCLQMMLPNEAFVEWVRSGEAAGALEVSALQRVAAAASCG